MRLSRHFSRNSATASSRGGNEIKKKRNNRVVAHANEAPSAARGIKKGMQRRAIKERRLQRSYRLFLYPRRNLRARLIARLRCTRAAAAKNRAVSEAYTGTSTFSFLHGAEEDSALRGGKKLRDFCEATCTGVLVKAWRVLREVLTGNTCHSVQFYRLGVRAKRSRRNCPDSP